jgi:hypothetical protein
MLLTSLCLLLNIDGLVEELGLWPVGPREMPDLSPQKGRVESSKFSRVKIGRIARMGGKSIVPIGSFNKEADLFAFHALQLKR